MKKIQTSRFDVAENLRTPEEMIEPAQPIPPDYSSFSLDEGNYRIEFGPAGSCNWVMLQRSSNLSDWQTIVLKPSSDASIIFTENPWPGQREFFRMVAS